MSKFKVGDRACGASTPGVVRTISRVNDPGWIHFTDGSLALLQDVSLAPPSLDNLSIDDVVVDDCGREYTVLGVTGNIVFLADSDGYYFSGKSLKQLKDHDYTVKGAEDDVVELTLEDVAKLKGISVDKLRIKD